MKILSNTEYNKLLDDIEKNRILANGLASEVAVLNVRIETKNAILADTKKELVFYRELSEKERARADRAVDNLSQVNIQLPISELALSKREVVKKDEEDILAKQLTEINEMYADTISNLMEDSK